MLRELLEWLLSRGTGPGRTLGLDREAVAIAARYRRQRTGWEPHLAATKQSILDAAATCPRGGTALILGSGACLDVPLCALAARFDTVVLADAHHPRAAKRQAARLPNVRCLQADLSGLAARLGHPERLGAAVPIPDLGLGLRPAFTASVNLASQLPLPYLRRLESRLDQSALDTLGKRLVEAHLTALTRLPGRVCLVCDTAWERIASRGDATRTDALLGACVPTPDRTWIWEIAPRPEESFSMDRRNHVAAWLDFKAAVRAMDEKKTKERAAAPQG